MMKNITKILTIFVAIVSLSACTQYTPSKMNTSRVQLSQTTMIEQVPLKDLNDGVLGVLANHYTTNGSGPLDLTMTFDPASKLFTAMSALRELERVKKTLATKGVKNVTTQTTAVRKGMPSLIVSYDMVQALAPNNCTLMPGLEKENTTRFLGEYKFGCSVETMVARQIAHPADLAGNSGLGQRDGRRESIVLEGYASGQPRQPLEGIERDDLAVE